MEANDIITFIDNFNIHYTLLLRRYKRFTEIDDIHNVDIDVITYLDMILVQLRAICIESPNLTKNYTAQNLLRIIGKNDLAKKIEDMLDEEFFSYREGFSIKKALKIMTDKYICHYDSFGQEGLFWAEIIEKQLRSPFDEHNLQYIMQVIINCIGKGLSINSFKNIDTLQNINI